MTPCCVCYPKPRWTQESAKADFAKHHKQGKPAKVVPHSDCIYIFHVDADLGVTFLVPPAAVSAP